MKIEKCPFCGGEVKIDMLDSENSRNVKIYSAVHCPKCHEWFFKGLSKEKTIAAWNRRADHLPDATKMVSNADRIRGMNDEELAEFLRNIRDCGDYEELKLIGGVRMDYVSVIDWLKQPVKNSPL